MTEHHEVDPVDPEEVGLDDETPDAMQIEGAKKLANEARDALAAEGFSDEQIDAWARTYIAEEGDGDVGSFVRWIEQHQSG